MGLFYRSAIEPIPLESRSQFSFVANDRSTERLPDFLIIGAQKSASSWLHNVLLRNDSVYMPKDEACFFEDPDYGDGDIGRLAAMVSAAPKNSLIGIKRPNYLTKTECPARIAAWLPDAKLVAILRNPVSRAISAYYHFIRFGLIPFEEPNTYLRDQLRGKFAQPFAREILEFGLYGKALARYRDHFPVKQIHSCVAVDTQKDLVKCYDDTCAFLGIDSAISPHVLAQRCNDGIYSDAILNVQRWLNLYNYDYDRHYGRVYQRHDLKALVAKGASKALHVASTGWSQMRRAQPAPLVDKTTKLRLLDYYLPDIERLERMTGHDLTAWKRLS